MEEANNKVISENNNSQIPKREHLVEWVREWGGSTSDAALDPTMIIYSIPEINGFISYRLCYGCAVVFGDPVCATANVAMLTKFFHDFMNKQNIRIVYLVVSQGFAKWAINNVCDVMFEFGQELILNPVFDLVEK